MRPLILLALCTLFASYAAAQPGLTQWKDQMTIFGKKHCDLLKDESKPLDPRLNATYYDGQRVYRQIAAYTKDSKWLECADAAERVYRDLYLKPAQYAVPGYWNFSKGLALDYVSTKDVESKSAVIGLATKGAFAAKTDYNDAELPKAENSREAAYILEAYLNAASVGEPLTPRAKTMAGYALGHIEQWFEKKTAAYVRPFMVGLTAEALIEYHERTADDRVQPALELAAEELWKLWLPAAGAFKYTDRVTESGGTDPSPDLNMLIAPLYGWLYKQTGEEKWRKRGDEIFSGGVRGSYLENPKQFNQSYRWSFDYVRWVSETPPKPTAGKRL